MSTKWAASFAAAALTAAARCPSFRPCALIELGAFALYKKPAIRLVLSPGHEVPLIDAARQTGVSWSARSVYLENVGGSWMSLVPHKTTSKAVVLVIAHDNLADELVDAECHDSKKAGLLLGYPSCCVDHFGQLAAQGARWSHHLAATACGQELIDARCNRFAAEWGGVGLVGEMFPCSLRCTAAAEYANELYRATKMLGLDAIANRALSDSLRPVYLDDTGNVLVDYKEHSLRELRFSWTA